MSRLRLLVLPSSPRARLVLVGALVLAVLAAMFYGSSSDRITVSADFVSTVGVYPGSDVRLMGVPIGRVDSVTPHGATVRVVMDYDASYRLPADAKAVIISPSVVADRFVQLTPTYAGSGPSLASGAVIPVARTRVPVELDQIYSTAHDLFDALGPQGANNGGAVNRFLAVSADNLRGNGGALHQMLVNFGGASEVLGAGSSDFFSSVTSLEQLTSTLAADDGDVKAFNDQMAQTIGFLSSQRGSLSHLLDDFNASFATIRDFVHNNRDVFAQDVSGLAAVTNALVAERQSLDNIARQVPVGLDDLNRTWDPSVQAGRTRSNELEILKSANNEVCDALAVFTVPLPAGVCAGLRTLFAGVPQ